MIDNDPLWYKDAIIYEVHVRAFYDSNADGIGDFPGLTQKLPYLHDLGVTSTTASSASPTSRGQFNRPRFPSRHSPGSRQWRCWAKPSSLGSASIPIS